MPFKCREFEQVRCNLCGREADGLLGIVHDYSYVRCPVCRLIYLNPRPTTAELVRFFSEYYYSSEYLAENYEVNRKWNRHEAPGTSARLVRGGSIGKLLFLEGLVSGRSILDVSCGTGDFLVEAQGRGWSGYGTEYSQSLEDTFKEKGLQVFIGHLTDAPFDNESLDVITITGSFCQLQYPREYVNKSFELLKDGGYLMITTPNAACLRARARGVAWDFFIPPNVLYLWTPATIRLLMDMAGFRMVAFDVMPFYLPGYGERGSAGRGLKLLGSLAQRLFRMRGLNRVLLSLGIREGMVVLARK